jgi:hypothetical protein
MKIVSYVVSGGMGGEFPRSGTLADLLLEIPYLLTGRITPPLHVVNDLLARGIDDAGMSGGCQWEPFQIGASEWVELERQLKSLPDDKSCEFIQPPGWVEGVDDWLAWIMIHRYGMPEEFRILEREVRDLELARKQAMNDGNQERVEELHIRVVEAGTKLSELVMANRNHHRPSQ